MVWRQGCHCRRAHLNCLEFRVWLAYSPAYSFSRDDVLFLGQQRDTSKGGLEKSQRCCILTQSFGSSMSR